METGKRFEDGILRSKKPPRAAVGWGFDEIAAVSGDRLKTFEIFEPKHIAGEVPHVRTQNRNHVAAVVASL